jgi:hypothetical protein
MGLGGGQRSGGAEERRGEGWIFHFLFSIFYFLFSIFYFLFGILMVAISH